jgi:hypothetical protein
MLASQIFRIGSLIIAGLIYVIIAGLIYVLGMNIIV